MSNGKDRVREDQSDLFSVKPYASGSSIPVIDKVPETKEVIRRRFILRVVYALIAAGLLAFGAWLYLHLSHLAEVEAAAEAASDDGRAASIRHALELLEEDDDAASLALKLRLRSMLVLAGESDETESLAAAVSELTGHGEDVVRERGIASTYLALAEGNLQAAMDQASQIVAQHDYAAEAARARAMAARSVGNVEQALLAARIAADLRPEAPRHVALLAELMARSGTSAEALERLDALPEARRNPASRIARARIMDRAGEDIDRVAEHASEVLETDAATDREKAWARLLLARAAAAGGDRVVARRHLDEASEVAPLGDELFTLGLAEAALRIGATHLAAQVAENLPSPLSVDAGRRAQLSAELALAQHELREAETALRHAPAGPRTALARARLLEARGNRDEARRLYREAASDPGLRVPATAHLAAMELAAGNAEEAVSLVEPLLRRHPDHPDVVPIAVEARLGLDRAQQAMELVSPALEAHPQDVRLLAAKAHVQMELEQWEEALSTLDSALRIQDDDADLHADRGRAAQQLSRFEVTREAFDRALELSPSHPVALYGRLELDLEEVRPADARQILERMEEAEMQGLRLERLRGRLLVMEIAGQSGINELRHALREHSGDPSLTMSLGWLYMQAEQYTAAVRTFGRTTDEEGWSVRATLARALAQARMRASNPARAAVENLVEDLEEASLPAPVRAQLEAVQARLAYADDARTRAQQQAEAALEIDRRNSEAHLILAEIASDRSVDPTEQLQASLTGRHPSSKPLALLALRGEEVTEANCEPARRYRRAAPSGQYARGTWRVLRACRDLERSGD